MRIQILIFETSLQGKPQRMFHNRVHTKNCNHFSRTFQGQPTRNIISQIIVQKCTLPVYSNKTFRLELFASPTSPHCSVHWSGSARGGRGSGIPVYPKKIHQNTQKYPKFIQIYPKLYPSILYTWNSKKVICRIPEFKLQYTVYPIWKAPVYRILKNPGRPWLVLNNW